MNFYSDGSICSLIHMRGFGESTPQTNSYDGTYATNSPVATDLSGFAKEVQTRWKGFASNYGTAVVNHSMIDAHVLTTQPLAQKFLRELGFTEFEVQKYGKYPHGISCFLIKPTDLAKAVNKVLGLKGDDALPVETFR